MSSTGNMKQLGDIRETVADLEHQFHRMKGDHALRAALLRSEIKAYKYHKGCDDIWPHVRKMERDFHFMQGDYGSRISSMQAITVQCQRKLQILGVSLYSGVNTGGSLPAPQY